MFTTSHFKDLVLSIVAMSGFVLSLSVMAAPVTLAPFPAPGGTTASGVGNTGMGSGRTWTLSNFNSSAYSELYYVVGDYPSGNFSPAGPRLWMDASPDLLSFNAAQSNFAGGQVVWTGTTNVAWFNGGNLVNSQIATRFTLSITDLLNNPLALIDASTINGMPASVGAAYQVLGDFNANWLFTATDPRNGVFTPAVDLFNSLNTVAGTSVNSSVGGAFYSTPPVPVPAAVWLFGSGLLGLISVARRKA